MSELDVVHRINGTRRLSDTLSFLTLLTVWFSIIRGYDIRTGNGYTHGFVARPQNPPRTNAVQKFLEVDEPGKILAQGFYEQSDRQWCT